MQRSIGHQNVVHLSILFVLSSTAAQAKVAYPSRFNEIAVAFNQGKYAQSKTLADALIKTGSLCKQELGMANAVKGLAEESAGDFAQGAKDIQAGLKLYPDLPDREVYLIALTEAETETGNIKKAVDAAQDAVCHKRSGLTLVNRAYVSINAKDSVSAFLDIHNAESFADYPKDIGVKLSNCALASVDENIDKSKIKCSCKASFHHFLKLTLLPVGR